MAKRYPFRSSTFHRYPADGYVGGVCAGLAAYMDWNVRLIRALAVLSFVFGGGFPVLIVYGLLWYVMDNANATRPAREDEPAPYRASSDRYSGHRSSRYDSGYSRTATASDLKARFSRLESRLSSMEECVTSNDYELRRELRKLES